MLHFAVPLVTIVYLIPPAVRDMVILTSVEEFTDLRCIPPAFRHEGIPTGNLNSARDSGQPSRRDLLVILVMEKLALPLSESLITSYYMDGCAECC